MMMFESFIFGNLSLPLKSPLRAMVAPENSDLQIKA